MSSSARHSSTPVKSSGGGGVHSRLAETPSTTLQEDVFQRMMSRMQQGGVGSQVTLHSLSARPPRKPRNRLAASGRKSLQKGDISGSSQNPQQQQQNSNSTLDQLPNLISSLRGALSPRPESTPAAAIAAAGSLYDGGMSQRQNLGASAAFLQNQKERDHNAAMKRLAGLRSSNETSDFGASSAPVVIQSSSSPSVPPPPTGNLARQAAAAGLLSDGSGGSSDLVAKNLVKAVTGNSKGGNSNNNNNTNNTFDATSDRQDAIAEAEHRLFGGGPVPASLRAVINELKQEVTSRLKLADIGTFRNSVQSLFECRSLIDQVLKQMPSHWHFRDETVNISGEDSSGGASAGFLGGGSPTRVMVAAGGGGGQQHQQQSQYDLFGASAISAADAFAAGGGGGGGGAEQRHNDAIQHAAQQKLLNEMIDECRKAANVSIPTGAYSVDSVSGRVVVDTGHISGALLKMQEQREGRRRRSSTTQQASSRSGRPDTSSQSDGALMPLPSSSASAGDASSAGAQQQHTKNSSMVSGGTLANVLRLVDAESDEQRLMRQLRRSTQVTNTCSQTDEYMKDELSKEDFEFQNIKNRELEVIIKEYEGTVQRLRNQLRIAQGALATRSGTVTYIRETLFKECSILRTQLQVLQQYYLQHGNNNNNVAAMSMMMAAQQQQQQGGGGAGGASPASATINSPTYQQQQQQGGGGSTLGVGSSTSIPAGSMSNLGGSMRVGAMSRARSPSVSGSSPVAGGGAVGAVSPMMMSSSSPQQYQLSSGGLTGTNTMMLMSGPAALSMANLNASMTLNQTMTLSQTQHQQQQQQQSVGDNNKNASSSSSPADIATQPMPRPPPYSTLALQPLAPIHSLLDTILCAVENESSLVVTDDEQSGAVSMEQSKEAQLRELKGQFAHQHAHWKRETADARSRYHLAMERKNDQLRKVTMASNVVYLRKTLLNMFGEFKEKFQEFKQGIRGALKMQQNFMQRGAKDIEFGIQKAAGDLERHGVLVKQRDAIRDVIFAAPDLILPTLAPEFAMGYHSWSFADSNEPLKAYALAHFGKDLTEGMTDELNTLHDMFVEIQRFGVRVHQLPDVHRPKPGWLMSKVAQGLLRSAESTSEQAAQIRTYLERDDQLAMQQAKVNIAIHGVIIRRKVLADRIRAALREGEVECAAAFSDEATLADLTNASPWGSNRNDSARLAAINATYSDIPTCASRFAQFAEDIDTYHIRRMKLQQQRLDNARQLFQLWRNSGVDVTGGRYAIVSRDPDGPWVAGLVKTRRLRGPRGVAAPVGDAAGGSSNKKTQQQNQSKNGKIASRYGTTGSTNTSPVKQVAAAAAASPLAPSVSVSIVEESGGDNDNDDGAFQEDAALIVDADDDHQSQENKPEQQDQEEVAPAQQE